MISVKVFFAPILAETFRPRPLALAVVAIGALQVGMSRAFNFGLPCAFHKATGIPCPGCGLTRSVIALLQGHPYDSFEYHPFGMLLLAGLVTALVVGVLPDKTRGRILDVIERVEVKTGFTAILMVAFMLLWCLRVVGVVHLDPLVN